MVARRRSRATEAFGNAVQPRRCQTSSSVSARLHTASNASGRLTHWIDAQGATTEYRYDDGLSQPTERIDPLGRALRYHYDTERNLVGLTNPKGERYELTWDLDGRLVAQVGFDGRRQRYEYDAEGRLVAGAELAGGTVDEPQWRTTRFERDAAGRLLAKALTDGSIHRFAYDALGRLLKAATPEHELDFVYDPLGRIAEERQAGSVVAHQHDAAGRRVATTLPDGQRLDYAWSRFGRLEGVSLDGRPLSRHRWNEFAQEAERDQGDLTTRYAYDPAGRLVAQAAAAGQDAPTLIGREYRRDATGRIASIHDLRQGDSRYTYDPAGQLLDVHGVTPERFVHDPAGNLLGGGDAHVEGDRLLMQGDRHFRYDAAGDLVEERRGTGGRLVTRYEYDASHRLAAAHTPHGATRYRYDALGRRVAKATSSGETRFFWDGATLLGESEAGEARGVGEFAASTRWYVYEPGSFRPLACVQRGRRVSAVRLAARDGQALAVPPADATEVFHYHLDHLGTPREMTDARGRIVWSARYRAWGALAVADVDEVDNPLRFQGQYHDAETGLYYNFQRYYDPGTGRFITQDPVGLLAGANFYRYVPDPLGWIDPLGLAREPIEFPPEIVHPSTVTPESPWGIHSYPATGDYSTDRAALVDASGMSRDPGPRWQSHHVDYDPQTNTMRGQFVDRDYHTSHAHVGGANDFQNETGFKYGTDEAVSEASRRNAALGRGSDCG